MTSKQRQCQECGGAYEPGKRHGRFCSTACRKAFNNRRMLRGAELYDLYMASRYQREQFAGNITVMAQVATVWREEDAKERAGRRSWHTSYDHDALTSVLDKRHRRREKEADQAAA